MAANNSALAAPKPELDPGNFAWSPEEMKDRSRKREEQKYQWKLEHCKIALQASVEFGKTVVNALVLINGGAMVAVLTLLGAIWRTNPGDARALADKMIVSMGFFALGLLTAVVSTMLSYAAQKAFVEGYANDKSNMGSVQYNWSIVMGGLALLVFLIGTMMGVDSMRPPRS